MSENERIWSSFDTSMDGEHFCWIKARKTNHQKEKGEVIAIVDTLTGRVLELDTKACDYTEVRERITSAVASAKRTHPCSVERMESILCSVVDYECGEGLENGKENLISMGFEEEEMVFFGFPACMEEG